MVTLATAVNSTETTWALSEALPDGTEYLQADDELVAVITPAIYPSQRDEPTLTCEVQRGVAGTQEAHAQGTTLATLAAPPLGPGGEQTTRLLGPFHVAHDTAGFGAGSSILLTEITGPALVTQVLAFVGTAFDGGSPGVTLTVAVGGPDYGLPDEDFLSVASFAIDGSAGGNGYQVSRDTLTPRSAGLVLAEGAIVALGQFSELPTQGSVDIYALIAEPTE